MTSNEFKLEVLVSGVVSGKALVLDDALSFWGGFDPANGTIIDVHHPQYGESVANAILLIPKSRGSAGTPGSIAETLRNGTGPLAFVLGNRDVNIAIGVQVANQLYDLRVPVFQCSEIEMKKVATGDYLNIDESGVLTSE